MNTNLSNIVDTQIEELKSNWLKEVRESDFLKTYKTYTDEETIKKGEAVYSHLSQWIKEGATNENAAKYFDSVGSERFKQKFPLTEVHYAIYLLKKIFWNRIDWRDKVTGSFETENTTKIMNVFNDYFDLANFHISKGYFNELLKSIDDDRKFSKEDLRSLLLKGKLEAEELEDDEFIWRHV
ncbi:MAG: RsbRD N-terminal domain-containing protein [Melioribacteraceae bacterium]